MIDQCEAYDKVWDHADQILTLMPYAKAGCVVRTYNSLDRLERAVRAFLMEVQTASQTPSQEDD